MMQSQFTRKAGPRPFSGRSAHTPSQRCIATRAVHPATAGLAATASALLMSAPVLAAQQVAEVAELDGTMTLAVGGGAAIAGLSALLVATDPQKRCVASPRLAAFTPLSNRPYHRRSDQMEKVGGDEKDAVRKYFNTTGFERWNKIYGETDEVNKVQMDIRQGHAQTVDKVLRWVDEEGGVQGLTVCDAGCGTGSLAIPLALKGAAVSASDISASMAAEAERRFQAAVQAGAKAPKTAPAFYTSDLESISGKFHTVTCLDVMIHYPQDKVDGMIDHLASCAESRLIISFAPKTIAYSILKRIGELFPGPSKATRAYLHREEDVEVALQRNGFKVVKREMTATSFYFSRLLEAVRA